MKFKSKPHTIEAFQFTGRDIKPPKWFVEAYEKGQAIVTLDYKDISYIVVVTKSGTHKAFIGDWVCINASNTMFVLSDEELKRGFSEV